MTAMYKKYNHSNKVFPGVINCFKITSSLAWIFGWLVVLGLTAL